MIWYERDQYRWHRRYAWRPRKIAKRWIWLEPYAWRYLRRDEEPPRTGYEIDCSLYELFVMKDGFQAVKQTVCGFGWPHSYWINYRPNLRAVNQ